MEPRLKPLNYTDTVDLALVHRRQRNEVFLTDARAADEHSFHAAALLPREHPHYTSLIAADKRPEDLLLLLECCRQAETYAAHVFYGVRSNHAFLLKECSVERFMDVAHDIPEKTDGQLLMTATTTPVRMHRDGPGAIDYDFKLLLAGKIVGQVRLKVAYLSPEVYATVRSRGRIGAPQTSDTLSPEETGRLLDPARAGRTRITDVVLRDVRQEAAAVVARLRVPLENPSFFDHAHDHVPGMVLIEAARQLVTVAASDRRGSAGGWIDITAITSAFIAYAELNEEVSVTATLMAASTDDAALENSVCYRVVFRQRDQEIASMTVQTFAVDSCETGPATRVMEAG
jgi:hypothetical protein